MQCSRTSTELVKKRNAHAASRPRRRLWDCVACCFFIFTIALVRTRCCAAHCFLQNRCRRLNTKSTRTPAANVPVQTAVVHSTFTYIRVHAQSPPVHTHTQLYITTTKTPGRVFVCVRQQKWGRKREWAAGLLGRAQKQEVCAAARKAQGDEGATAAQRPAAASVPATSAKRESP